MKGSLLDSILFNFNNDFIVLHRHFCTKCAVCKKPITALKGETKIKKLRAMGKEYHLHCFKCEVSKISFFCDVYKDAKILPLSVSPSLFIPLDQ